MSYRNSTKASENKKENSEDATFPEKRRKIVPSRLVGPVCSARQRQGLTLINAGQELGGGGDINVAGNPECEVVFTKDDVEPLLKEKLKIKNKNDFKGKCEHMGDYIKRLKACIKWFQDLEQSSEVEREKLQTELKASDEKCNELEEQIRKREGEMTAIVADLNRKHDSLKEELSKETAEKLEMMDSYKKEVDARAAAEKLQASLSEELHRARQDALSTSNKMKSLEDDKKRLQEYNTSLQQYNSTLQAEAKADKETISKLQMEKTAMMETLTNLRGHNSRLQEQLNSSKSYQNEAVKQKEMLLNEVSCLREELNKIREDRELQIAQVHYLKADIARYNEISGKSAAELEIQAARANVLEERCSSQKDRIQILESQLDAANDKLQMADLSSIEKRKECEEQKKQLQDLRNRLTDAENRIVEAEELRKKLHNTILELKGNIRVFCRVRPLLPDDDFSGAETSVISFPTSTELLGRGIELIQSGHKYPFSFDKVFNHDASQEDVFVEISQLVQSALDGYKVCIFAYGQTGSGKTYTMMGRPEAPEQKGLIPRSLEQIFQSSQSLQSQGWTFRMQASMLEIYNETIRDLLCTYRSGADSGISGKQYAIKHDANGNTHVSDLTIVDVCSIREVSSLLHQAAQSRSVGKTQMNEQSSRSHFVFSLRIFGANVNTEQQVQGVLNLIDLAGSERLSRSGATGDRLKETQAINKSLSSLSDVIFAIAKKEEHVPFRNSKLTYLLQPCLGGDSKTLMFVNISPEPSSANETLCSLRFAARVNACEIGVARRQTYVRSDSRLSCG